MAASGQACVSLEKKFQWSTTDATTWKTLFSSSAILGISLGSIFGGKFSGYCGKRMVIIVAEFIVIPSALIRTIFDPHEYQIMLGNLVHGFGAGLIVSATAKIIEETVPLHVQDRGFGTSTNMMINVAIMINMLLGMGMPTGTPQLIRTVYWKTFFLIPIPFAVVSLVILMCIMRTDSLLYHVKRDEKAKAMQILSSIYKEEDEATH